jgi:hypothetical protein
MLDGPRGQWNKSEETSVAKRAAFTAVTARPGNIHGSSRVKSKTSKRKYKKGLKTQVVAVKTRETIARGGREKVGRKKRGEELKLSEEKAAAVSRGRGVPIPRCLDLGRLPSHHRASLLLRAARRG